MATITNLTSGIEIDFKGAVTYIKHGNVKLLKRGNNINVYDDSDDDGNQRGQVYISIPFSEVTSPSEANIDALYTAVRGYIDVSSGGGGADTNAVHVNAANEITAITEKTTVANIDEFIIEDSGASFVKKSVKRKAIINPISITTASTATLTVDTDVSDFATITAQAEGLTIGAPTGSPVEGQKLIIRLKDDGSARAITFNAIFRALGVTLPTTTVVSKTTYLGLVYNSTDTKWDIVATKTEA
jgi:hypothetical protein